MAKDSIAFADTLLVVEAVNRQAWREWLQTHHQTYTGIWLLYYKVKSGKPSVQYREAVKEALCFGWIDSKVKSIDAERYRQIFTPRKPQSVWSKLNKTYVEELIQAGLMTQAGLDSIRIAQENGSWNRLDEIEALIIPEELQQALRSCPEAERNFEAFNTPTKKTLLTWIGTARRKITREQRIQQVVTAAAENHNPLSR
jgi:uncharacterized protein YdeI (YjbR/CyaY-like superfamily)